MDKWIGVNKGRRKDEEHPATRCCVYAKDHLRYQEVAYSSGEQCISRYQAGGPREA